jgi:hypothetical protein
MCSSIISFVRFNSELLIQLRFHSTLYDDECAHLLNQLCDEFCYTVQQSSFEINSWKGSIFNFKMKKMWDMMFLWKLQLFCGQGDENPPPTESYEGSPDLYC